MREIGNALVQRIQELDDAARRTRADIEATTDSVNSQTRDLTGVAVNAVERLGDVGKALVTHANTAGELVDGNTKKLERASDRLQQSVKKADVVATDLAGKMTSTNQMVQHQMQEITKSAKVADGTMEKLTGSIAERHQEVVQVTDDSVRRLRSWDKRVKKQAEEMQQVSEDVVKKTESVVGAMHKRTGEMRVVSDSAEVLLNELRERAKLAASDDFLRHATFVMERLQSLAVDMNRLLETEVTEEDWKRYNRGEKGVFVRKILGFREKAKLAIIRDHYREDQSFRDYVSRYIKQFHNLVEEAKKRDTENVMNTTLLSSDMGKLFMLLNRAIERGAD